MTSTEARKEIFKLVEQDVQSETAGLVRRLQEEAKQSAEREAHRLIAMAIQRYAAPHATEMMTNTVQLANDDVKGRIIDSEEAVVLVLLNDRISYKGYWWNPNITISSVSGQVKVNVPSYIPIQAVRQVHASGFGTPSHSISALSKCAKLASWVEKPAVAIVEKAWHMASNQDIPASR
jgi:hypothetical protein